MSTDGKRVSDLPEYTTPQPGDWLNIVDVASGSQGSKKITYANAVPTPVAVAHVNASGDETGATDSAAIAAGFAAADTVVLHGRVYINETISMLGQWKTLAGDGQGTIIYTASNAYPIITIGDGGTTPTLHPTVRDLQMVGGENGIYLNAASHAMLSRVQMQQTVSHGIYGRGGMWITHIHQCKVHQAGGDGIRLQNESVPGFENNGNNTTIESCAIWKNTGYGVRWNAQALKVSGSTIEENDSGGILIHTASNHSRGVVIDGNYFEHNKLAQIKIECPSGTFMIDGVHISGNFFNSNVADSTMIHATGNAGFAHNFNIDGSNAFVDNAVPSINWIDLGYVVRNSIVRVDYESKVNVLGLGVLQITRPGDVIVPATESFAIGWYETDGTWRMARDGDNLVLQRRETGTWVTKQTYTP